MWLIITIDFVLFNFSHRKKCHKTLINFSKIDSKEAHGNVSYIILETIQRNKN